MPIITSTPLSVWFQEGVFGESNDSESSFRELIWYDRLDGRTALGHYKLEGATPSISFRLILRRLSEASNISRELIDILEGRSHDEGSTRCRDSEEDYGLPRPSNYPDALLGHLWEKTRIRSLTAITLDSRLHSSPVSLVPLLQGLYLLIQMRVDGSRTSNGRFESREVGAQKDLKAVSAIGRAFSDGIAGIILGLMFISMPNYILKLVESLWFSIHVQLLRENISWLETFPAGFKLNVPLTTNMGREILLVVSSYESALVLAVGPSSVQLFLVRALGLLGALLGFSMVSALVFDTIRLSTLHIKIISGTFCRMFRALLYTQSSLWKLFRGKKLNPLRHRTDTLEYDSMQLLLGTMLFTICLFLFTTLLVYYAFFTTVALSVAGCGVLVWILHILILRLPLGEWLVRLLCPQRFPRTVYFAQTGESADGIHTSTLVPVSLPIAQVYTTAYGLPLSRFFSRWPHFIGEVFTGRPTTIIETCLDIATQII